MNAPLPAEDVPEDDSVCFFCGWPDCRCNWDDDDSVCEHGVPFDEDCEECDEEDEWQLP